MINVSFSCDLPVAPPLVEGADPTTGVITDA